MAHDDNVIVKEPVRDQQRQELKPPRKYAVILLNDDYTTMALVTELVVHVFHKTYEEAQRITLEVHEQGSAVAGVYTREIAETKATQIVQAAQREESPLQADIRPIDNDGE